VIGRESSQRPPAAGPGLKQLQLFIRRSPSGPIHGAERQPRFGGRGCRIRISGERCSERLGVLTVGFELCFEGTFVAGSRAALDAIEVSGR